MFGGTEGGSEEAGLVQRSLRALFRSIKLAQAEVAAGSVADNDDGGEFGLLDASSFEDNHGDTSSSDDAVIRESSARATFFEIFNEKVYDLLSQGSLERALNVREDAARGVYVDGLEEMEVRDVEEAEAIIAKGLAQRSIASTSMNRTSSRSHACFVLTVRSAFADASDGLSKIRTSRFTLVDLAGALCCIVDIVLAVLPSLGKSVLYIMKQASPGVVLLSFLNDQLVSLPILHQISLSIYLSIYLSLMP